MIQVAALHKAFDGRIVLAGIDLAVPVGSIVGVIGPGGCGKTLLLKLLAGLERADAGSIRIDGREVAALHEREWAAERARMGMLFQNYALFDSMTVGDNVAFPQLRGEPLDDRTRAHVIDRLAQVGLHDVEHLFPQELSGGMKKRVGIARALFGGPSLLLLDEPSAGLDPVSTYVVNELILRLRKEEKFTAVVATFDFESVREIVDRVVLLYAGSVHFAGTPAELLASRDPLVRHLVDGVEMAAV